MKTIKLMLSFVLIVIAISCNNDDDSLFARGKVTFKVGNVEKSFSKLNSFNKGVLALSDSADEHIGFSIPIPTQTPVTYNMDSEVTIIATYKVNNKTYTSTNGALGVGKIGTLEIKITKYENSKITGTFKFTAINKDNASDKVVITDGVFTDIPDL